MTAESLLSKRPVLRFTLVFFWEVSRAPAAFHRNKRAVLRSAEKRVSRDSYVTIETNKQPMQQHFDYENRTGALHTAFLFDLLHK